MTEYRYRELTEAELRELEPGTEIWVRNDRNETWALDRFCHYEKGGFGPFKVRCDEWGWVYAAIREPVEPEQRITMDRKWQTEYGAKVRLYCVDAPGKFPVHGHVEGFTFPSSWDAEGKSICGSNNLIPAPDWREQIPWDALADWVQWVDRDGDGAWRGHSQKPRVPASFNLWTSAVPVPLGIVRMPEGPTDWREAIAQRPESK